MKIADLINNNHRYKNKKNMENIMYIIYLI